MSRCQCGGHSGTARASCFIQPLRFVGFPGQLDGWLERWRLRSFASTAKAPAFLGSGVSEAVALPLESGRFSSFAPENRPSADFLEGKMSLAFARDHKVGQWGLADVPATRVGRYRETCLCLSRTL